MEDRGFIYRQRQELQWIISPAGRENRSGHDGQLQKKIVNATNISLYTQIRVLL